MTKKLAALVVVAALAAAGVATLAATAADIDSLHERRNAVEDHLRRVRENAGAARERERTVEGQIRAASDRIDAVEERLVSLGSQLAALRERTEVSQARLASLQHQLAEETRALRRARRELRTGQRQLARRVVAIYTSGERDETELVSVVLGATDLDDLIDRVDTYSRIVEQDEAIVASVERERDRVARSRARTLVVRRRQQAETLALQREQREQEAVFADVRDTRDRLDRLRGERERTLASVRVERRQWETEADALAAADSQLSALIRAAETAPPPQPASPPPTPDAASGDGSQPPAAPPPAAPVPVSPGFVWPVRGTLTSPFGQRWGRLHGGIDIAAPAGTPIVAAAAGTVIYAGSMSGYGLIVVLQHAGGIATAYAHNSSIAVGQGQQVAQGQTIAAVGCTGSCTGDHVHFELRVNGSPVDPMGYL